MWRRSPPEAAGFTLIEVLVALVLLVSAVVAVQQTFGTAFRGIDRVERVTTALLTAESRLAEMGVVTPLEVGEQNGLLAGGYRWRTVVAADAADTAHLPVRAFTVAVTVFWGDGSGQAVTLRTLRLAPRDG